MFGNVKEQKSDQILELDQILDEHDTSQAQDKVEGDKDIHKNRVTDQIASLARMIFSKGIKTQANHIYIEPSTRDVNQEVSKADFDLS